VDRHLSGKRIGTKAGTARKAVAAARRGFIDAMRRGDAAALAARYDDGAIVVPQTSGVCRGRASIQKLFRSWLSSARIREFVTETKDLRILGEAAFEVGTYRMVIEDRRTGIIRDEGKFLIVYERQSNGTWLISRDMSSSTRR
jgi:ketosteroid isomerase-like protein